MVLAGYAEGTVIKVSEFGPALRQRGDSISRTAQILDAMGVLADDRPAAFDQWLATRLGGLAPGISGETERWARALHDGTPRTPALHDKTVRSYVAALRPALLEWSASHAHLREITPGDVRAAAAPLHGSRRQMTLVAARRNRGSGGAFVHAGPPTLGLKRPAAGSCAVGFSVRVVAGKRVESTIEVIDAVV
jgi:hypothetical protein